MNQTFCFLPNGNGTFFLHQMFLTWEVLYSIASLWHFEQDYATINNMRLRLQHDTRIGSIDLYHTYLSECMLSILKSYKITPKCVEMYSWSSYCIGTALRSYRLWLVGWQNVWCDLVLDDHRKVLLVRRCWEIVPIDRFLWIMCIYSWNKP